MAHATTPHTQTQQNTAPEQSDVESNQLEQTAGIGSDAEPYRQREGAQTGGNRGPQFVSDAGGSRNTEPAAAAREGSVTTRAPGGSNQGISSHSADEEQPGQEKVVNERPDANAGVNHNR